MASSANILNWSELMPVGEWQAYQDGLTPIQQRGLQFVLGGGLAFSAYSWRWRNTKDMDIYVLPEDHPQIVEALTTAGFEDYYTRSPYDRSWSYRAFRNGTIIDVLWAMPNHVTSVKEAWLTTGPELEVRGMKLRLIPAEELIWLKLYVFQRARCDWPDLLNILFAQGPALDWKRLLCEMSDDRPLLGAVLALFGWMCPARAQELPDWMWAEMGLSRPLPGAICSSDRRRVQLLESRDWFGPNAGRDR